MAKAFGAEESNVPIPTESTPVAPEAAPAKDASVPAKTKPAIEQAETVPAQDPAKPAPNVAAGPGRDEPPINEATAPASDNKSSEPPAAVVPATEPVASTPAEAVPPTPVKTPAIAEPVTASNTEATPSDPTGKPSLRAVLADAVTTLAPSSAEAATDTGTGTRVKVDQFEFSYGLEHPDLPRLVDLEHLSTPDERKAKQKNQALRAAHEAEVKDLTVSGLPDSGEYDSDALLGLAQKVVRWYNARGLNGVWVAYSDLEASPSGVIDNRAPDDSSARLVIWASQIAEVRTLARGKRIKAQNSINNRKHKHISRNSPLHAGTQPGEPGSLFSQEVLDRYLFGLSLHPGRRVEASIASTGDPGKVILDYLVTESKAWQVFTQINNFGSEGTGVWRARVGYQDNQLTNHDDILNVDGISTPDFKTYGSFLSYRIPVFRPAKLLARVYGSYGDFLATDTSLTDLRYAGKNWLAGLELTNRLTFWRVWQLISVGGANFNHYGIQSLISDTPLVTGYSDFLVPFLGTTLSRDAQWWAFGGGIRLEHAMSGFANEDPTSGIPALGRIAADAEWTSLRWNITGDVFLDRLFHDATEAYPLVNQLSMRTKGRMLLRGNRLIPHEQEPLGGALSVRGYPEAIVAADEFISATIEYAYHIPRGLKPGEPSTILKQPFKWRPTQPGQNPDWDLSVHAFFDYAYRAVTPAPTLGGLPAAGEGALIDQNLSMAGTGLGVQLLVKGNFMMRCDYGMALMELRDETRLEGTEVVVPKGNTQLYFVTTFSW